MRLADADREILFEQLGRHAAAGRLDTEELERRVAAIAGAVTLEDAAAVMADLPPLPPLPPDSDERGDRPARRWGRGRGHGEATAPRPGWLPTAERFRDPATESILRVWVDAAGGRHYVPEEEP